MKQELLFKALELKYKAQIAEARAELAIYFESSVGIGEHPQHLEEMDKFITQITDGEDKLESLRLVYNDFYQLYNIKKKSYQKGTNNEEGD
jgi:hypothetical protein